MNELVDSYGCSVVLLTATQPAPASRTGIDGFKNVRDIIIASPDLIQDMVRVDYEWPDLNDIALDWQTPARRIILDSQVLKVAIEGMMPGHWLK